METNFRKPYSVSGQTELLWKATTTRQANATNNTREKEIKRLRRKDPTIDHNDEINRGIRYSSQGINKWLIAPKFLDP